MKKIADISAFENLSTEAKTHSVCNITTMYGRGGKPGNISNPFAKYGGMNRISSMVSQILKVTAAVDSGKISQDEGYNILRSAGIGDKELTDLINLVSSLR